MREFILRNPFGKIREQNDLNRIDENDFIRRALGLERKRFEFLG
jgi:hypothetical protein